MVSDKDLDFLTAKRLLDLKRRIAASGKPEVKPQSDRDIVSSRMIDRGLEVLELAEMHYPEQVSIIVENLAGIIKKGGIKGFISGGELLWLFRQMGLRIHVETSIQVKKDGKLVPLKEKLKSED